MSLNFYLILIVILLVLIFASGILLVICRKYVFHLCCGSHEELDPRPPTALAGRRNRAFDDCEQPAAMQQAPFVPMDGAESPPTYEEAVKQELFRYHSPLFPPRNDSGVNCPSPNHEEQTISPTPQDMPSTSSASSFTQEDIHITQTVSSRHRPSNSGSGIPSQLSTIDEEEDEHQWPIQVVIDCIGVQTTRLLDSGQTVVVNLEDGHNLDSHSKC